MFMTFYLHKVGYIFHVKIQLFVTTKSDQNPDPDTHMSKYDEGAALQACLMKACKKKSKTY
jgi:hypothetical protein